MEESIDVLIIPIMFLVLAGIFYLLIELRIKMLKCRG